MKILKEMLDLSMLKKHLSGYETWAERFAENGIAGASVPSIKKWVSEKYNLTPSIEILNFIADYEGVGVHVFFKDKHDIKDENYELYDKIEKLYFDINKNIHSLPFYKNAYVSAGNGLQVFETERVMIPFNKDELLKNLKAKSENELRNVVMLPMKGNSMEPTLKEGHTLIVRKCCEYQHEGVIYVIRYDNELRVKRLAKREGKLYIISDNIAQYPAEPVSEDLSLEILGAVIGTYNYDFTSF
ncbi:peptidase S24 LexA-like protein [Campylobacter sp. RM5004]|uniref:S24 family peptidase n=1 Tax=Campylobacter sp. RM5004 TaxID=1660078 RepID=UPI001EFBEB08|nr:S24 family peptidase [Campylobacter sp. RM5004]ULO01333.1 peptidase S24 LexA-like protein [Campylobacter sp. RM5004]